MDESSDESTQDFELTVNDSDRAEFKRLDVYLVHKLSQFSRSTIKRLLKMSRLRVLKEL